MVLALIVTGLIRITGIFSGSPEWNSLLFYTVLSNMRCLVWMVLLIVRTIQDLKQHGVLGASTPSARWSGAVMMAISVTMLIYLLILVPADFQQAGDYELFSFADNLIHIITPCLLIGDWLLFVGKGAFRWIDPLLWALIPYAYLVFGFTYGALGGEFARYLVSEGLTVIAGLAAGIDTAAHRAALDAGGRTVAFIGNGITRAYPIENAALQREIAT